MTASYTTVTKFFRVPPGSNGSISMILSCRAQGKPGCRQAKGRLVFEAGPGDVWTRIVRRSEWGNQPQATSGARRRPAIPRTELLVRRLSARTNRRSQAAAYGASDISISFRIKWWIIRGDFGPGSSVGVLRARRLFLALIIWSRAITERTPAIRNLRSRFCNRDQSCVASMSL